MASNWTKINVYEEDQFAFSSTPEFMNSVYIPGFSSADINETDSSGNKFRAQPRVPILCTSIAQFKKLFGEQPAKFVRDETYEEYEWEKTAYDDTNPNIVNAGELDRAYIMACELLSLGLPVVYERMNIDNDPDLLIFYLGMITDVESSAVDDVHVNETFTVLSVDSTGRSKIVSSNYPVEGLPKIEGIYSADDVDLQNNLKSDDATITIDPSQDAYEANTFIIYNGNTEETMLKVGQLVLISYTYMRYNKYKPVFPIDLNSLNLSTYSTLMDKNEYPIKFITLGGYPCLEWKGNAIAKGMLTLCRERGDCIALFDHTDYPERPLYGSGSLIELLRNNPIPDSFNPSFGAIFTPWATYEVSNLYKESENPNKYLSEVRLPASFAYLSCVANTVVSSYDWLAIAGVTRGACTLLKEIEIDDKLTNAIAEYYLDINEININGITAIGSYGQCIWGNRTLHNNKNNGLVGLSFLNQRSVVCDVKKLAYVVARELMFEQNNDILWVDFVDGMSSLLDLMVTGNALKTYKILKNTQNPNTGEDIPPFKLSATIRLYPVFAVEYFDIYVVLTNDDVPEVSTEE